MFKLILKIIWFLIAITALLLTLYFLLENNGAGINNLIDLSADGFWNGFKQFFVSIWEGIKAVCGIH